MIRFRLAPDMFVAYPASPLAVYTDLTMPKRDWSKYDAPAKERVNVAKWKIERARALRVPALLRRQAS